MEEEQLERALALIEETLGADLVGVYVFGSAASGVLTPTSDVDLLALTRRPTTQEQRRRLAGGLLELSKRPRHLELTVVVESDVRPWRYPPTMDFQYGDWMRAKLERGEVDARAENPYLTVLIELTLLADRPLLGPPATATLDPIPRHDLVQAMVDEVEPLLAALGSDTRNVLLTLARIWTTVDIGEIRSKDAAAEWALHHLPAEHRRALERARDGYRTGDYGTWDDVDARGCADALADGIRRSRRRRGGDAPR